MVPLYDHDHVLYRLFLSLHLILSKALLITYVHFYRVLSSLKLTV